MVVVERRHRLPRRLWVPSAGRGWRRQAYHVRRPGKQGKKLRKGRGAIIAVTSFGQIEEYDVSIDFSPSGRRGSRAGGGVAGSTRPPCSAGGSRPENALGMLGNALWNTMKECYGDNNNMLSRRVFWGGRWLPAACAVGWRATLRTFGSYSSGSSAW